mmetsp:Transcript_36589/g.71970  ORF Transcript_36589/g.71970 Transcript_36589/m.71970 type:complete len:264 (-) Transcript_36589:630-1421(-)
MFKYDRRGVGVEFHRPLILPTEPPPRLLPGHDPRLRLPGAVPLVPEEDGPPPRGRPVVEVPLHAAQHRDEQPRHARLVRLRSVLVEREAHDGLSAPQRVRRAHELLRRGHGHAGAVRGVVLVVVVRGDAVEEAEEDLRGRRAEAVVVHDDPDGPGGVPDCRGESGARGAVVDAEGAEADGGGRHGRRRPIGCGNLPPGLLRQRRSWIRRFGRLLSRFRPRGSGGGGRTGDLLPHLLREFLGPPPPIFPGYFSQTLHLFHHVTH